MQFTTLRTPYFLGLLMVVVFSFFTSLTFAQSTNSDLSGFRSETDTPFRVGIFQEIPGFWSKLSELDSGIGLIDSDAKWFAMADADIWVFFLKDRRDAAMLPPIARAALEVEYDGSPFYILVVTFEQDGRTFERLMHFSFLSDFSDMPLATIGCRAATTLYSELDLSGVFDLEGESERCLVD